MQIHCTCDSCFIVCMLFPDVDILLIKITIFYNLQTELIASVHVLWQIWQVQRVKRKSVTNIRHAEGGWSVKFLCLCVLYFVRDALLSTVTCWNRADNNSRICLWWVNVLYCYMFSLQIMSYHIFSCIRLNG